jgi:hypothetical protein
MVVEINADILFLDIQEMLTMGEANSGLRGQTFPSLGLWIPELASQRQYSGRAQGSRGRHNTFLSFLSSLLIEPAGRTDNSLTSACRNKRGNLIFYTFLVYMLGLVPRQTTKPGLVID